MLIVTRRKNERILIGSDIYVAVLAVRDGQVRIGIDAPKEVAVHREEVFQRTKAQLSPSEDLQR